MSSCQVLHECMAAARVLYTAGTEYCVLCVQYTSVLCDRLNTPWVPISGEWGPLMQCSDIHYRNEELRSIA